MGTDTPSMVLVVDDEPGICELLETLLKGQGYNVQTCCSAVEALSSLRRPLRCRCHRPEDAGMDGLTLIRQLKTKQPEIAAIMITGYAPSRQP